MKKFEYAELTEQCVHGTWLWLLDNDIVNPDRVTGWREVIYESLSLVQALNVLGEDGWQAVTITKANDTIQSYTILLMREVI